MWARGKNPSIQLRAAVAAMLVGVLVLESAAVLADPANAGTPTPEEEFRRGRELFEGKFDLQGRIRTHVADLPPEVVRCGNCHAVADGPEVPRSLAPRLTHELLIKRRSRRGGPASNYDRSSFCALLRDGFDPAHVLISVEMPRYTLADGECAALWRYLTGSGGNETEPH